MPSTTRLRLFVSSPSDVAPERARVDVVAARLNGELEGLAEIDVIRWETGFYTADRPFQAAIDAAIDSMRSTDIVVCILWKRVGSELDPALWRRLDGTPYESGTVLEFETALSVGRERNGVPDAYLFRKRAPIAYAAESFEAERLQHQLLEAVWRRWTESGEGHNVAGYQRFDDADDFETQLELCLRQWLERKGVVVRAVWDRARKGSPFRGLAAFESEHAAVFFGRDLPIARAIAKLRAAEAAGVPLLVVVGASGAGKSSLLRAGLIPRITRPGVIPGIDLWRSALVVPAGDPLSSLAAALFAESALGRELAEGDFHTPELLAQCFEGGAAVAAATIRGALDRAARHRAEILHQAAPRPARLLVAVDQVERVLVEAAPERVDAFAAIIATLVEETLASVILALRSDAYAGFQKVAGFVHLVEEGGATYNLLPPGAYELEDIVTKPVEACEPPLVFAERGLAERLVADARGGDALPLLQMALQRLYEAEQARGDGMLRAADYSGIDDSVARTAGDALATLPSEAAAELPALVTALVGDIPAAGALPVVVPLDRAAFERGLAMRKALIDAFIDARLLTTEEADGRALVRPTHDALLRTWPAAVGVIADHAALIRVRHTLEPMAADWAAADPAGRPGYLATSAALLAGAEQLLARFGADLPEAMRGFIVASLAAAAARRDAERRRQRRVLAATASGLFAALVLAALAGWQWTRAEAQRRRAEQSLALATDTANGLVFDLADKFRNLGLPVAVVADIVGRARKLQDELFSGGENTPALRHSQADALLETADTLFDLGDTNGALAAAKQAHGILQLLVAAEPNDAGYLGDLAVSDERIGDALRAQGDLVGALAAYREGLAVAKRLAADEPANTLWQEDLSVDDEKIGDVLQAQGDLAGALAAYRASLAIRTSLAAKDGGNSGWQRDIAVSEEKIGDVLQTQGDLAGALAAYDSGLAIRKALAAANPGNTQWQRDLSVSDERIGDVLRAQGDLAGALAAYRDDFAISNALAQKDRANTEWQRDLSISDEKIGDVLRAQGKIADALVAYRQEFAIVSALAQKDAGNAEWQRDLAIGHERIGDVLSAQGDLADALAEYRAEVAIAQKLSGRDPTNVTLPRLIFYATMRIGDISLAQGDLPGALAAFEQAAAIARHLQEVNPTAATNAEDLIQAALRLAAARLKIGAALPN